MFKPQTRLGKWSVGAAIVALLVLAFSFTQDRGLEDLDPKNDVFLYSLLASLQIAIIISVIIALFAGLISIIKYKERSISVFGSILISLYLSQGMIVLLALSLLGLVFPSLTP